MRAAKGITKNYRFYSFKFVIFSFISFSNFSGNVAVDYITSVEPTGTNKAAEKQIITEENKPKKVKISKDWKEKCFKTFADTAEKNCESETVISSLKAYNLLLRNIKMEADMGLNIFQISHLRSHISAKLNEYPNHLSGYVVEPTIEMIEIIDNTSVGSNAGTSGTRKVRIEDHNSSFSDIESD